LFWGSSFDFHVLLWLLFWFLCIFVVFEFSHFLLLFLGFFIYFYYLKNFSLYFYFLGIFNFSLVSYQAAIALVHPMHEKWQCSHVWCIPMKLE
jgi:hypothetical protein